MNVDQNMEDSMSLDPSDVRANSTWARMMDASTDAALPPIGPESRIEDDAFGEGMQQFSRRYVVHSGDQIFTRRPWAYDVEQGMGDGNTTAPERVSRMRERPANVQSLLYHAYSRAMSSARPSSASLRNSTWNDFAKHQKYIGSSIQIKHWQLRDLVRCPFERDDVFVVKGFAIYRYDISRQNVVDRHGFLFEPTCFGFGESFLGVAGEVSEYAVQHVSPALRSIGLPVENSIQHYGSLQTGGHVNNAIKITEDLDGRLSAFLCNNSGHLMVMTGIDQHGELQMSESSSLYCPVSINHCAISEKERTLVYVGDSEEVFVCRPSPTGYRQCCTFREATDAGMSCDWNSTGTSFAVASQDGLVCVWDRRHKRPVARLTTPSAARCVKFSPDPLDLLAFTEHRNYLHLVDCRMWENRQIIKVRDDMHEDIDICGFDFSPCGSRLYVGTEDSIDVLEINRESRTSFPYSKLA